MIYYCAGYYDYDLEDKRLRGEIKNRLVSYFYTRNTRKRTRHYLEDHRRDYGMMLLDSGAFSVWNSKDPNEEPIDLDAYIEYCREYDKAIDFIANLDVIPGKPNRPPTPDQVEASAAEGLRNYKTMIAGGVPKDKVIHTFHQGEDWKWLELMVNEMELPYIGLSPGNDRTQEEKMEWLHQCMPYVTDKKTGRPKVKFHGFAATGFDMMRMFPWFSVDSGTWGDQGVKRIANLPRLRERLSKTRQYPIEVKYDYSSETPLQFTPSALGEPEERKYMEEYLSDLELPPGALEGDFVSLAQFLNVRYFNEFVKSLISYETCKYAPHGKIKKMKARRRLIKLMESSGEAQSMEKRMHVDRNELKWTLGLLKPGLTTTKKDKSVVQQSGCYLFRDEWAFTFNGYIAFMTHVPPGLTIDGAVPAEELNDNLARIKDEKLVMTADNRWVHILRPRGGKDDVAKNPILSSVPGLPQPGSVSWKKLGRDFLAKLDDCLGYLEARTQDLRKVRLHWNENKLEIYDPARLECFLLPETSLPMGASVLLRGTEALKIFKSKPGEYAVENGWAIFKSLKNQKAKKVEIRTAELFLACRMLEEPHDVERFRNAAYVHPILDIHQEGRRRNIIKILEEALAAAKRSKGADKDQFLITLKANHLRVESPKHRTNFDRDILLEYHGNLTFVMNIRALVEILKRDIKEASTTEQGEEWSYIRFKGQDFEQYLALESLR